VTARMWSVEDAIEEVRRSTTEQGVSFHVVDPTALRKVAVLLTAGRAQSAAAVTVTGPSPVAPSGADVGTATGDGLRDDQKATA